MTEFKTYRDSIFIKDHINCKHIKAGDYSYYSGYYHGHSFEDYVMYLDKNDDKYSDGETDQLIIGKLTLFVYKFLPIFSLGFSSLLRWQKVISEHGYSVQ